MVRFLHTADWQLGMARHYLGAEAQPRFAAARTAAIRTIGALAVEQGCAFVVVCGDVFETNQVDRQVVVRALDAMAATPSVTFYLLPGNHDPLDAGSVFRSPTFTMHQPPNVVVLTEAGPRLVAPGVELVAAPWRSKRPLADLVAAATAGLPADGTLRIAVGHGAVDHLSPDDADPALILVASLEAALAEGRIHYVALGDRHSTTAVGRTGRAWYSGSPEPTDFREDDAGNVLVVELDAASIRVTPHHVGTWRFLRHDAEVTGDADLDLLAAVLDAVEDKARTIVRLGLVGQLSLREKARLDTLLAHRADLFASLEGWERRIDLVVLPDEADFDSLELSGFAKDALADLQALGEGSGPDALVAQDALSLLFRISRAAA
ncbi:MAG TPA: metallophosphoesterase [Acidimicrobiales bacterium]|jgi:DNA repair exonuclease SbcCD nuclease subunit|nr:metallophosphoesterase [Acidimicrobiales bacterium]